MKKLLLISLLSCHCYAGDLIYNNGFESPFKISGSTSGLTASGLQLNLSSTEVSENFNIETNGAFTFNTSLPTGSSWVVSINSQPSTPQPQSCTLTNNSGEITNQNVSNLQVLCVDSVSNNWDEMEWDEGEWH